MAITVLYAMSSRWAARQGPIPAMQELWCNSGVNLGGRYQGPPNAQSLVVCAVRTYRLTSQPLPCASFARNPFPQP